MRFSVPKDEIFGVVFDVILDHFLESFLASFLESFLDHFCKKKYTFFGYDLVFLTIPYPCRSYSPRNVLSALPPSAPTRFLRLASGSSS